MKKFTLGDRKYAKLIKSHKLLKLSWVRRMKAGQKLLLGVYNHGIGKFQKFIFVFEALANPKGNEKKFYVLFVHGKSKFLENLPMAVCKPNMEIRIALSSDISPVFLIGEKKTAAKARRRSPSVSATLFPLGMRKKGGDGKMWEITMAKNDTKRWVRIK